MDPRAIGPDQWDQITRSLIHLILFVSLMANTALSFLIAHGVIPSLVSSGDVPPEAHRFRRILYPVSAVSLLLTFYVFWRVLSLAVPALQQIYPRFAI